MTVSQLRPPVVAGEVAAAREALDRAAAMPVSTCEDWALGEALAGVTALEAQAAALRLEILAEADRREVAEREAATGTDAWAARLTGSSRAVMAGGIWLARMLRERYHATRQAFASGAISEEQARVIVRAAQRLPAAVTDAQRAAAEEGLVEKARAGRNPRALRQAARRMLEKISKELADEHEADQLEEEEDRAERETWMSLHDNGDGTFSGRFTIPELHGQLLMAALERLNGPRRYVRNKAGEQVQDETVETGLTPSWTERLGAAFAEILEHLPTTGHGAVAATLLVKLDYQHLLDQLGSAALDTGVAVSARTARRLACGAGIVPMVLDGNSQVLDAGRRRRLHTEPMRQALALRHDSCAAEGCERPFAWCEMHHPQAWSAGGVTSVDNALPLCGHHHRRVHDSRFRHRRTGNGEIRFSRVSGRNRFVSRT